jgi:hypothetical protein
VKLFEILRWRIDYKNVESMIDPHVVGGREKRFRLTELQKNFMFMSWHIVIKLRE